jgi:hypothetical protein
LRIFSALASSPSSADKTPMDLSASTLLTGLLISSLGAGIFLYGKANAKFLPMIAGGAMCLYPFFISSPWLLWTITAGLCALLYIARERSL